MHIHVPVLLEHLGALSQPHSLRRAGRVGGRVGAWGKGGLGVREVKGKIFVLKIFCRLNFRCV